ncbi:MAG: hypothetical protein R3C27_04420 [Hyphomonadaceae bacterium]
MRIVLASLAFIALAGPVAAQQQTPGGNPDVLDQVYSCRSISDEAQRLACYDGAVGRLQEAQNTGNLVAVDRGQAQEMDREAFGFSLPSLSRIFGGGSNQNSASASAPQFERVDNIQMQIASVTHRRNLPSTFRMTNGQVWVQIDDEVARNVRDGGNVTIHRASMGSYLMSVEAGGPAIRVRRQQ